MKILIIGENNPLSLERIYKKNFKRLKINKVNICTYWKPRNYYFKKIINFIEKYLYFIFCYIQNFLLKIKLRMILFFTILLLFLMDISWIEKL